MKNYDSVSVAVNNLIKRGYAMDFTMEADKNYPVCHGTSIKRPLMIFK